MGYSPDQLVSRISEPSTAINVHVELLAETLPCYNRIHPQNIVGHICQMSLNPTQRFLNGRQNDVFCQGSNGYYPHIPFLLQKEW